MKTKYSFPLTFACIALMLAFLLPSCAGETLHTVYYAIQKDGISYDLDNDLHEATAKGYYVENGKHQYDLTVPDYVEAGKDRFKVVKIADRAFAGTDYKTVTIGSNVRTIGNEAFAANYFIETLRLEGKALPLLPENAFEQQVYDNARLIVLPGVDVAGTGWQKFTNISNK